MRKECLTGTIPYDYDPLEASDMLDFFETKSRQIERWLPEKLDLAWDKQSTLGTKEA